jgi:hypothetical protein
MAKNLSWLKAFSLIGTVLTQLSEASADGIITVDEALVGFAALAKQAGFVFDDKGSSFVMNLITEIFTAAEDGKITVAELIAIGEKVCEGLGIQLDKTVVAEVPKLDSSITLPVE